MPNGDSSNFEWTTNLSGVSRLQIGRLERHVREGDLHGIFDGVQQLDDDVGDVLEAQFPPLRGSQSRPNLQRVEQERLEEIRRSAGEGVG